MCFQTELARSEVCLPCPPCPAHAFPCAECVPALLIRHHHNHRVCWSGAYVRVRNPSGSHHSPQTHTPQVWDLGSRVPLPSASRCPPLTSVSLHSPHLCLSALYLSLPSPHVCHSALCRQGYLNGGPVALVWYWWISAFFVLMVGFSFAEIASSFPVSVRPPRQPLPVAHLATIPQYH